MRGAGGKEIGTVVALARKTVPVFLKPAHVVGVKFTRKGVLSIKQRSNQGVEKFLPSFFQKAGKVFAELFSKSGKSFCGAFFKKRQKT